MMPQTPDRCLMSQRRRNRITLTRALIERLPKTDLHVHLDGSLRLSTLIELARRKLDPPAKTVGIWGHRCDLVDGGLNRRHVVA